MNKFKEKVEKAHLDIRAVSMAVEPINTEARTRAMIISFLACCDAPFPNGISDIQMKDNDFYIDNVV